MMTSIKTNQSFWQALLITLFAVLVYYGLCYVPLPFLRPEEWSQDFSSGLFYAHQGFSVIALGMMPWFTGFLFIELLAFFLPPLNKWRKTSVDGRAKLNQSALVLSLLIATYHAHHLASNLIHDTTPGFNISIQSQWFYVIAVVSMLAGTSLLFGLARFITYRGVGNGFAIFVLVPILGSAVEAVPFTLQSMLSASSVWFTVLSWLALVTVVVWIVFRFKHRPVVVIQDAQEQTIGLTLPFLAQGVVPAVFAWEILSGMPMLVSPWSSGLWEIVEPMVSSTWYSVVGALVLMPLIAHFTWRWFSQPSVIGRHLKGLGVEIQEHQPVMLRHKWSGLVFLLSGSSLLFLPVFASGSDTNTQVLAHLMFQPTALTFVSFFELVAASMILKDIWDHIVFICRHPQRHTVGELDNVYLAQWALARLEAHHIDGHVQALHFRSLFFFLEPVVKMNVWVPEADLDKAKDLLAFDCVDSV